MQKAINRHQIENFPEHVSTFYVEHDIDGDDSEISCLDFLINDRFVKAKNYTREEVSTRMREFGFDDARQATHVTSLSGGWKMRLALARAMLCDAGASLLRLCGDDRITGADPDSQTSCFSTSRPITWTGPRSTVRDTSKIPQG